MKPDDLRLKIAYAAPGFALAAAGVPLYIYLPQFYSDVVGIPVGTVGLILLAARLFDAFTDPVLGIVSDRIRAPFWRRKGLILLGMPVVACGILMLLNPIAGATTAWLLVGLLVTFAGWTLATIPYESLAPDLADRYDDRTSLVGWRDGAIVLGLLIAAALPPAIARFSHQPTVAPSTMTWTALIICAFLAGSLLIFLPNVPAPTPRMTERRIRVGRRLKLLLRIRAFRVLTASFLINAIGSNLPAALMLYYVQYVLESDLAPILVLAYLLSGVLALPWWTALARRTEKHRAFQWAMIVHSGAFAATLFCGPGDILIFAALTMLSGTASAAVIALPSAMQSDVIDQHRLAAGQDDAGLLISLWAIGRKLTAAVGIGVALPLLQVAGYQPGVAQEPRVIAVLKLLYIGIPVVTGLTAAALMSRYPLDRAAHSHIRSQFDTASNTFSTTLPLNESTNSIPEGTPHA